MEQPAPRSTDARANLQAVEPYLNLGLNDGTYMPEACTQVLRDFAHTLGLRNYSTSDNRPLCDAIARVDGCKAENVFLHNGSGPILKQVVPSIIRSQIKSSPLRVARHLLWKTGFPIVAGSLTYGKVPVKAMELGLRVEMIPVGAEDNFKLDANKVDAHLQNRDSLLYVVNPNNPTGQPMLSRSEIQDLATRHPRSVFWVDEAYIQYMEGTGHSVSDLVTSLPNLCVGRTFSFAYGMAGARIGYLLCNAEMAREQSKVLTDYRVGTLQEELAIAALGDADHLPFLRKKTAEARAEITDGLRAHPGIEVFPSQANFVLARFTDGRKAKMLADGLEARGIHIKTISPFGPYRFDEYFRITTGLPAEHARMFRAIAEILA